MTIINSIFRSNQALNVGDNIYFASCTLLQIGNSSFYDKANKGSLYFDSIVSMQISNSSFKSNIVFLKHLDNPSKINNIATAINIRNSY